jgi:hypothetical protein
VVAAIARGIYLKNRPFVSILIVARIKNIWAGPDDEEEAS